MCLKIILIKMSKRKGKQSYSVLKKIRISLWKEDPNCYYCHKSTVLPTDIPDLLELQAIGITPDYMATIEHLLTRYDAERFEDGGEDKCVLACYKCNHEKERERSKLVPKEELQKRSNRFPLAKFVTEAMKKEIVEIVYENKTFSDSIELDLFLDEYFKNTNIEPFAEKYGIESKYISGTIKQHRNLLKRKLDNGKQQTEVETPTSSI